MCGKCCNNPEVEASVIEMLPLALRMYDEGKLEFWDKESWVKKLEVEPIFNRAVIFSIEDAPHGHPIPLNTPDNVSRYSLALYYITNEEVKNNHTVVFYKDEDLGITKKNDNIFKI
jgi:hypothetical protein